LRIVVYWVEFFVAAINHIKATALEQRA